jgi:hypothetical protein
MYQEISVGTAHPTKTDRLKVKALTSDCAGAHQKA